MSCGRLLRNWLSFFILIINKHQNDKGEEKDYLQEVKQRSTHDRRVCEEASQYD